MAFTYKDYEESERVKQLANELNTVNAAKPEAWNGGTYGQLVDDAMNKILNREKFTYDLNGDALYKQYKDQYSALGKQAMMDTMGQASALTGGYGNSYASTAGNQAYQAYLQQLNNVVPELYGMARESYDKDSQALQNQYSMLADRQDTEYGQYRDRFNDWNANREYATNLYNAERDYDYGKYSADRTLAQKNYEDQIAQEQWQKQYEEGIRQYNEQMAFEKQKYADTQAAKATSSSSGGSSRGYSSSSSSSSSSSANKFTGSTYEEAASYLKANGKSGKVGGLMTKSEFSRRKASYQKTGIGSTEVKNYGTYSDYLKAYANS